MFTSFYPNGIIFLGHFYNENAVLHSLQQYSTTVCVLLIEEPQTHIHAVHSYILLCLLKCSLSFNSFFTLISLSRSLSHTHTQKACQQIYKRHLEWEAFSIWRRTNSLGWLSEKRLWPQIMKHIIGPAFTLKKREGWAIEREEVCACVCLAQSVSVWLPVRKLFYFILFLLKSSVAVTDNGFFLPCWKILKEIIKKNLKTTIYRTWICMFEFYCLVGNSFRDLCIRTVSLISSPHSNISRIHYRMFLDKLFIE